jgi:iron(III) transport system substrate-binding protein
MKPATLLLFLAGALTPQDAPAQTLDDLYSAAKREGLVTWYSVILGNEAALPLARAFEARYPGIKVDHQRGNTLANAKKIIDEAKAGSPKGDVFDGSTTVVPLLEANLVEPWVPPSAAAIPERYRDPRGRWSAVLLEFLTVGYDAGVVAPADVPKTREDLLDPKWRNKMIWSASPGLTGGAGFVGNTLMDLGEDRALDYLTKLKGQNITAHSGDGHAVIEDIAAGKYPLGLQIFNHHTFLERAKGHNIQWVRMEPVLGFSNNIGLVKSAPHPNAAKLFVNFVLSSEGQTIIRDGRHIPASDSVQALEPSLKTGFSVNYVSPVLAAEKMAGWQAVFARIFR